MVLAGLEKEEALGALREFPWFTSSALRLPAETSILSPSDGLQSFETRPSILTSS